MKIIFFFFGIICLANRGIHGELISFKKLMKWILFFIFFPNMQAAYPLSNSSYVYLLRQDLLGGYDFNVRPVKDQNTATNVTMDLSLMQVISMVKFLHCHLLFLNKLLKIFSWILIIEWPGRNNYDGRLLKLGNNLWSFSKWKIKNQHGFIFTDLDQVTGDWPVTWNR